MVPGRKVSGPFLNLVSKISLIPTSLQSAGNGRPVDVSQTGKQMVVMLSSIVLNVGCFEEGPHFHD